ncbi:MAG TPA: lipopolysaccharide heptosyltransferase II [bacterium]|nr:lipopolysaccharide heptosyltransferase II [bacterium]
MNSTFNYSNILIRVPNWLGDSMMATPVVASVKKAFPKAKLSILCKPNFVAFWKSFSEVHEVLTVQKGLTGYIRTVIEIKNHQFDVAVTLPSSFSSAFLLFAADIPKRIGWGGEGREFLLTHVAPAPDPRQKHLVWEYLELIRAGLGRPIPLKTVQLAFPLNAKIKTEANQLLKSLKVTSKSMIALGPGATYGPAKHWPLVYWKQLILKMLESGQETLLVVGGSEEKEYLTELWRGLPEKHTGRLVSLVGKTTPGVLAGVLNECKVLVTNDTGPMHVAAAVGIPAVAIFGSTSPTWTRPFGEGHTVIYKAVECSPCFQKTCPIGYICLNRISVSEVFEATKKKLKNKTKVSGEKVPKGTYI